MGLAPYENLKGFASSKPPLMVFIVVLGMFAVVLMTLSYYVQMTEEVSNPDMTEDWNAFLGSFADLEFCITGNASADGMTTVAPTTVKPAVTSRVKDISTPITDMDTVSPLNEGTRNYSVSMLLSIHPTKDFLNIPHNLTHLTGTIYGSEIGLKGSAADEPINVTMELPYEWNSTQCSSLSCKKVDIYACVYLQAAAVVFPKSRSPDMCESMNDTGIEYHAQMKAQRHKHVFSTFYCKSRPVIKLHYKLNPRLSMWLSFHDRSVINLHLMHTSYFLFVMVVTLFCYALLRGRPTKIRVVVQTAEGTVEASESKEPLTDV